MKTLASRPADLVAVVGLAVGAVLGLAGSLVSHDAFRQVLWGIDGAGLVVAAALLAVRFLRAGEDIVAAGFLVFAIGEGLLVSGTAAGLQGSIPSFGGGVALWSAGLVLFVVFCGYSAFRVWKNATTPVAPPAPLVPVPVSPAPVDEVPPPPAEVASAPDLFAPVTAEAVFASTEPAPIPPSAAPVETGVVTTTDKLLWVSLPMIANAVPPNRFYGFRTRQTLSNERIWYRANRFAGWALFTASIVSAAVLVSIPQESLLTPGVAVGIFVAPLLVALAASYIYLRRIGTE